MNNSFNDDNDDDYDEIIDRIKKFFSAQADVFDIEFFIFPNSPIAKRLGLDKGDEDKGFKISYHYNSKKMDEPKVDIKGNIDKERLKKYLKRMKAQGKPGINKFINQRNVNKPQKKHIDANELSFKYEDKEQANKSIEQPLTEINDYESYSEVILEAPGISENKINIIIDDNGRLKFQAKGKKRIYQKTLNLPFECRAEDCTIEGVRNGIVILKIHKK